MLYSILTTVLIAVLMVPTGVRAATQYRAGQDSDTAGQAFDSQRVEETIAKYQDKAKTITQRSREIQHKARRQQAGNKQVKAFAEHIRRSLGINPQAGQLYVFVSLSMGRNLIRSYMQEGAWAGAQLVVRGIPKGMTIKQYLLNVMKPLVQGQPGAGLKIDPRLFDLYGVDTVPTIVWQPGKQPDCRVQGKTPRKDAKGKARPVPACSPTDRPYWSVEGAVTLDWALEHFGRDGSKGARKRLAILRKNVDKPDDKVQQAYAGDWSKARLPGRKFNPTRSDKRDVIDYTSGLIAPDPLTQPGHFNQ